jgi:hypothetical protein
MVFTCSHLTAGKYHNEIFDVARSYDADCLLQKKHKSDSAIEDIRNAKLIRRPKHVAMMVFC